MIRKTFAILDYGVGNYNSIAGIISRIGHIPIITSNKIDIKKSNYIILPGVGTYPESKNKLRKNKLLNLIIQQSKIGKPILGICLGMQLLATISEEIKLTKGLNIIPGKIIKNKFNHHHIGWNKLIFLNKKSYFKSLDKKEFYFQHNYSFCGSKKYISAYSIEKNIEIPSIIQNGNIVGVQFHPEKSQESGLIFFKEFINIFK